MEQEEFPETYPLEMGYLPPKFQKKAETELFETPEVKEVRIKEVRELLKHEETIDDKWFSDEVITMYLRWRKYDVKRTFTSVKKMVNFIRSYPQYFRPSDPEAIDIIFQKELIALMPFRDKDGVMIFINRLGPWDPAEIRIEDTIYVTFMLFMHLLTDPMTQVNGVKWVYDFKAPLLRYLSYLTAFELYRLFHLFTECIPLRVVEANGINPNTVTKIVVPLALSFVSEKLRKRIFIHHELPQLLKNVHPSLLPVEYGGTLNKEDWKRNWRDELSMPSFVTDILNSQRLIKGWVFNKIDTKLPTKNEREEKFA